jgi:hypothetical protein
MTSTDKAPTLAEVKRGYAGCCKQAAEMFFDGVQFFTFYVYRPVSIFDYQMSDTEYTTKPLRKVTVYGHPVVDAAGIRFVEIMWGDHILDRICLGPDSLLRRHRVALGLKRLSPLRDHPEPLRDGRQIACDEPAHADRCEDRPPCALGLCQQVPQLGDGLGHGPDVGGVL